MTTMTFTWTHPKNEKEFENQIAHLLRAAGWTVEQQKVPEECKTWTMPFQVDIFAYKTNEYAVPFLIECKMVSTYGQGSIVANACTQLDKYQKGTYLFNDGTIVKGVNCNRVVAICSDNFENEGRMDGNNYYCPFELFMGSFLKKYNNDHLMTWNKFGICIKNGETNLLSIRLTYYDENGQWLGNKGRWVYSSRMNELPTRGEEKLEFEISP
jgi:hypothetical protein